MFPYCLFLFIIAALMGFWISNLNYIDKKFKFIIEWLKLLQYKAFSCCSLNILYKHNTSCITMSLNYSDSLKDFRSDIKDPF
jgi:hypothetical protein